MKYLGWGRFGVLGAEKCGEMGNAPLCPAMPQTQAHHPIVLGGIDDVPSPLTSSVEMGTVVSWVFGNFGVGMCR